MKYTTFFRSWNVFSNWYECEFSDGEIIYNCVEQYMMYKKACVFEDDIITHKILNTPYNPKLYKQLGRKVKNFNNKIWEDNREEIVYNACWFKFTKNKDLLEKLLNTKGTKLVEASPYDRIWGCGLSEKDLRINDESKWLGKNLLGNILTKLRDDLIRKESENES